MAGWIRNLWEEFVEEAKKDGRHKELTPEESAKIDREVREEMEKFRLEENARQNKALKNWKDVILK